MATALRQPRLVRRAPASADAPVLDPAQRRVVGHSGGPLLVLAGPGTGKTTTLVETVVARLADGAPAESVLVLTFSRRAARELRERIAARLGRATVEPLARTFHSYAFGVLRRAAAAAAEPAPRLLSGAEQDRFVRELLTGDVAAGAPGWPAALRPALSTRGFAQELRDLLLRCAERGIDDAALARVAAQSGREEWQAVARFARQYADVTALAFAGGYDPAELVRAVLHLWSAQPELLAREQAALRLVVVDELQDADPAQLELLHALAGGGRNLVAVGDPDQSIYAFRGADPDGIRSFPERFCFASGRPADAISLGVCRRSAGDLLAATRRVAQRLGGPGRQRALVAAAGVAPGVAEVHVLRSPAQEASFVAARLREAQLREGVPWHQMAVLVRSAPVVLPALRRVLLSSGVPVAPTAAEALPLADQPVVSALMLLLRCATTPAVLDDSAAETLLLSAFGGADSLSLRRLRSELRQIAEASAPECGTPGEVAGVGLLAEAVMTPEATSALDPGVRGPALRVAELLATARAAAHGTAEEVLWAVWSATSLAERWVRRSREGGRRASAADADLDAILGLFTAAGRFTDRLPQAGIDVFLDEVSGRVLPESTDPVPPRAASGVALLTAHASKGLEYDVVAVAGVQEGQWPDLRPRGSLLGRAELLKAAASFTGQGPDEEFSGDKQVAAAAERSRLLDEERRLFYVAATRARRRLLVTAVLSERDDLLPSRFLDELDPPRGDDGRPYTEAPRALELSALVGELRGALTTEAGEGRPRSPVATAAATHLARLAEAGVAGADPAQWYGALPLSDDGPLLPADAEVRVSPSKVESFLRCELRWFLENSGGTDGESASAGVGSAVHAVAAAAEELREAGADDDALLARLDEVLRQVDLGRGWAARRTRAQAEQMVRRLARWIADNPRRFLAAEVPFELSVGRAKLSGRLDRLDSDEHGRPVVIDFKTGSAAAPLAELAEHPQLGVYQLAVQRGAFDDVMRPAPRAVGSPPAGPPGPSGGAELVQLGGGAGAGGAKVQAQAPLGDSTDPQWPERLVLTVADGMAGAAFAAVTNKLCRVCPVQTSCPARDEGRMVGE